MKTVTEQTFLPEGIQSKLGTSLNFSAQFISDLLQSTELISLTKGSIIFSEGDRAACFYLVVSGAIKLSKACGEEQTLIDIIHRGEPFGVALMQQHDTVLYPVTAKTLGTTELLKYTRDDYQKFWVKSPLLLEFANRSVLKRIQTIQKDRCTQRFNLEQKVAYFMTEKWSSSSLVKITRQDIADSMGSSQEAVIRLLSEWSKQGLIQNSKKGITFPDVERVLALWLTSVNPHDSIANCVPFADKN